ncbi:MAG: Hpt domain-containing protein [Deltaproteobacteria bacterium]|nr:Hpt domain-containing protein [Deltaproteobacteria bacterium]
MSKQAISIDFSFLKQIEGLDTRRAEFLANHIERFLAAAPVEIDKLNELNEKGDREQLRFQSHKFVSTCSVVGAMRMIQLSSQVSKGALSEEKKQLTSWVGELRGEFKTVENLLGDYLTKLRTP